MRIQKRLLLWKNCISPCTSFDSILDLHAQLPNYKWEVKLQFAAHNFITWPDHRLKSDDRLWDFVILILQVQPFRTYSGNCTWHWDGFLYNMCPAQGMYTVPPSKVRTIIYFLFYVPFIVLVSIVFRLFITVLMLGLEVEDDAFISWKPHQASN